MYCYKIAGVGFGFDTTLPIAESKLYSLFRIDEDEFFYLENKHIFTVHNEPCALPEYNYTLFSCSSYSAYKTEKGYDKVTKRFNRREYHCICSQNDIGGDIYFTDYAPDNIGTSAELFRLIDLVGALLSFDAVILHGSVVEHNGKALIFSGASGVGKSTQAELWKKNYASEILNGDRVIVRRIGNKWFAFGIPMCGSSNYCRDFMLEVDVVVFLEQAKENKIINYTEIQKFLKLTSQITCGSRKEEETPKLISLTEDFAKNNIIIEFQCTKENDAVKFLKEYLERK